MTLNFKCRITCTSIEQLNFNGELIDENCINQHTHIISDLQPENIDYIDQIQIVTKTIQTDKRYFTTKTLEIIIKRQLERHEFVELIRRMKLIGFRSTNANTDVNTTKRKRNCTRKPKPKYIQFIDTSITPMKILYNYNYITDKPDEPFIHTGLLKNRSIYSTKVIYKK